MYHLLLNSCQSMKTALLFIAVQFFNCFDAAKDIAGFFKPQIISSGPWVHMTSGEIWPKPFHQEKSDDFFTLDPTFRFKVNIQVNIL